VTLTGASGHPASVHYADQLGPWSRGETFPWPFTQAATEADARDRLTKRRLVVCDPVLTEACFHLPHRPQRERLLRFLAAFAALPGLGPAEAYALARNSFEASFVGARERAAMIDRLDATFARFVS